MNSMSKCILPDKPGRQAGFTRLELLVIIATLALLAVVTLPVLAGSRSPSDRVTCLNNLRQFGMALHQWGNDHRDLPPWWTPWCEGGTRVYNTVCNGYPPPWNGFQNNLWFQLVCLSNDLPSPRLLVCPADVVRAATDWSANPAGGLLHPNYRNNAISYPIGLDANNPEIYRPDFFSQPMVLANDRNMLTNGLGPVLPGSRALPWCKVKEQRPRG